MNSLLQWVIGLTLVGFGFFTSSRLQQWDDATVVIACPGDAASDCTIKGVVDFDFWSGDMRVATTSGRVHVLPREAVKVMAFVPSSSGPRLAVVLPALLGILGFGAVTLLPSIFRLSRPARSPE